MRSVQYVTIWYNKKTVNQFIFAIFARQTFYQKKKCRKNAMLPLKLMGQAIEMRQLIGVWYFDIQTPNANTIWNLLVWIAIDNKLLYWSKVLTDQQGLCRFFWKHKIVKNLKTATIKQVIIQLSNSLYFFFFFQKMESTLPKYTPSIFTTVDYPVYWTFKITLSSIGFEWEKVLIC